MPKGSGDAEQYQQSNTLKVDNLNKQDDAFVVKRSQTVNDIDHPDAFADEEQKKKSETSKKKKVTTANLKEAAKNIPVSVPKKLSETKEEKTSSETKEKTTSKTKTATKTKKKTKPKSEKQKAIDSAKEEIKRLHDVLDAEEREAYKGSPESYNDIDRKYYSNLTESDIDKRAKNAVKRKEYAQAIAKSEAARKPIRHVHIDKETLKEKIALFKKMRSEPYELDSDEKFVANLDKNYQLCEAAERMKYWIDEASESGFMPEGEDMAALQEKIESLLEIKRYIDTQSDLMKNEYYQYMAKEDISYTDKELAHILRTTKNATLKNYLADVKTLRSLHFMRSKGMKSSAAYSKAEGKRQTEILATRAGKREMIDKLSDKALEFTGNKRFIDQDYDARFTPKLFEETLARFKAMNIKNLHFGSMRDIVDHYDENQYMFDQAHDMEHLLMVAIQRGLAPADDQLIELRAKIEALTLAEDLVANIHSAILTNPDVFINQKTYKEYADDAADDMINARNNLDRNHPPRVGCDLKKYLNTIIRRYKQEHKDREKTITLAYGLTHPVEGKEGLEPGSIPREELERRKAEYQKNAFKVQYMRNLEVYIMNIYGARLNAVDLAHARQTGRGVFGRFGRTLTPYLTGASSQEIIKVIDIMQTGSPQEKEELWTRIANEAGKADHAALDNHDPKLFYRNAAARGRMAKIIANLSGSNSDIPVYVKDEALLNRNNAYYTSGSGNDYSSAFSQAAISKYFEGVEFEDWFKVDTAKMNRLIEEIDENSDKIKTFSIGKWIYTLSEEEYSILEKSFSRLNFMKESGNSQRHFDRVEKGIRDTATVTLYDEMKALNVIKDATPEDLTRITAFYQDYYRKDNEKNAAMMKEVEDEIKKTDPGFKLKQQDRTWILSDMALLNKYKNSEEATRCAALYKGLVLNKDKRKQNDSRAKQERAEAIEDVFRTIMSFDINRFNFNSYMDIVSDPARFAECQAVTRLAVDSENYIADYRELRMEEDVNTRLRNIHVDEIQARCDLLMGAAGFFDGRLADVMSSDIPARIKKSFGDVMHLTPTEMQEYLESARKAKPIDAEGITFWTNVISLSQTMNGFDLGSPLANTEQRVRFYRGLNERSRVTEVINILNNTEALLQDAEIGKLSFVSRTESAVREEFAETFTEKEYTVSERESKLFNQKSRLYTKRLLAEELQRNSMNTTEDLCESKRKITLKNRIALGVAGLDSLSAFLEDDTETNNSIAEIYADKEKRFEVMDIITLRLMEMKIDFSVNTDEEFARASERLELISRRAIAYNALLKANPDYEKRLMNRVPGNSLSDLERVTERLNNMLAISDYYRARKALMTDSYYITHYNDEISTNRDTATNDDQRRVADMINLVAQCSRRLGQTEYRSREDSGIDRLLTRAETLSRQSAYLTGRPDLTKADPDTVHKHNMEIERYLKATGLGLATPKEKLATLDAKKEFPKAEKYRTKAVDAYLNAVKVHARQSSPGKYADQILSPQKKELFDKLYQLFKDRKGDPVSKPEFHDPVTGETWKFTTDIQRMPLPIANVYSAGMSNEEVLDIFEGLLIQYRTNIDMNDEAQRLYARERFLDSLKKIFRMQYDGMKRYESTYGTLADDLPFGCFMESMGAGQSQFIQRNVSGQDFSQMVAPLASERLSLSEGKNYTSGEILVKYGLITREELDDAISLCPSYYQNQNADQNNRFMDLRDYDKTMNISEGHVKVRDADERLYHRDRHTIRGPKISQTEARNIWKNALKHADDMNLVGSESCLLFQKNRLDLYTPAQKKELKAQRKKDARIISFYNAYLDDRAETLLEKTKSELKIDKNDKELDKLLKKLIVFHPAMFDAGDDDERTTEKIAKGTGTYYELIKQYAGIGITDAGEKAKARKEGFTGLFRLWEDSFKYSVLANDIEDMMSGSASNYEDGSPRLAPNEIAGHSKLFPGEVRHRMYDVMKEMATDRALMETLEDKIKDKMANCVKEQLSQEIFRTLLRHDFYLNLKDVGSRRQTFDEKMYQEISNQTRLLKAGNTNLDQFLNKPEFRDSLEYFGISTQGIQVFSRTVVVAPAAEANGAEADPVEAKKTAAKQTEKIMADAVETNETVQDVKQDEKINADAEAAAQIQHRLHYELPPIQYLENVVAPEKGTHTGYEKQGRTSYCWACVMSGLMNAFAGRKVSSLADIKNRPLAIPEFEESGVKDLATYDAGIKLVMDMYEGNEYGNPAIFGDYIQQKIPNAAVRSAIVSREAGRLEYCKRRFLETLSKNLEKGPVGMLTGGHFVLVRELRGDTLMVNDSMKNDPDAVIPYDASVAEIFANAGQQVELVWLEDMKEHEQELADQFDLNYNAETKSFSFKADPRAAANAPGQADYKEVKNEQTILHRNGIEASAQLYDDVVFNFVYLPKQIREAQAQAEAGEQQIVQPVQQQKQTGSKQTKEVKKTEEKKATEKKTEEKKATEKKAEEKKATEKKAEEKKATEKKTEEKKTAAKKPAQKKTAQKSAVKDEFAEFGYLDDGSENPDFGNIEGIAKEDEDTLLVFDVTDRSEENWVENNQDFLELDDMITDLAYVENDEERRRRLIAEREHEVRNREKDPGLKVSGEFEKLASREKAMKGSFSKEFIKEAEPFIARIEEFGSTLMGENDLIRAMGVKSIVELMVVGGRSLQDHVSSVYNYKGNDTKVLQYYAAKIAAAREETIAVLIPREIDGQLTYEPNLLAMDTAAEDKTLEADKLLYRRNGIRAEQGLRGDVLPDVAERAGRAFRQKNKLELPGFTKLESLSDHIGSVPAGSDRTYSQFVTSFRQYYQAVERFAYIPLGRAHYARLLAYLREARDLAAAYMHGKKVPKEKAKYSASERRHLIGREAMTELNNQFRILDKALDSGILSDDTGHVTFEQIFRDAGSRSKGKKKN